MLGVRNAGGGGDGAGRSGSGSLMLGARNGYPSISIISVGSLIFREFAIILSITV